MTTEEKVALVETTNERYGLNQSLAVIGLPKSTWYYHQNKKVTYEEKHADLLPDMEEIALKHPEYGWPRMTVELCEEYSHHVNHKVVQRLLRVWDLQLMRNVRRPKPSGIHRTIRAVGNRANLVAHMDEIGLFEVLYTDFTEILYANGCHKAHLIPILGHASKIVYGWAVGEGPTAAVAIKAWERAKKTLQELGVSWKSMIMHHDRGSAFISYRWAAQLLLDDRLRLSYALRGAKDNPLMESFNSRFKEEGRSLFLEAQNLGELTQVVDQRMDYHNTDRRHSTLGYVAPLIFIHQQEMTLAVQG
jgi:transposase InsO family protein